MEFRAKLQMKMENADQPGVATMNFVPVDASLPTINLTAARAAAVGLETGRVYRFVAQLEDEPQDVG